MLPVLLIPLLLAAPPKKAPAPAPAPAQEDATVKKAKDLFQWAQKLYKQARYAEAISRFEEAYSVRPHPVIYFNIGKCYEQLGETAKALRAYRDYLRLLPDAKDRETVNDAIANLERRLREKGQQQLMVFADPPSARISVDGKELGSSPASVELVAGNHTLLVQADGYERVERSFVMQVTRATEMTITLRPQPKDAPLADAPKVDPQKAVVTDVGPPPPPPPVVVVPVEPGRKPRVWTWVAGGVAVASAGGGVGLWAASNSTADQLRDGTVRSREDNQKIADAANGLSTGSAVAYGVAGAAAVTAVVLFFLEK